MSLYSITALIFFFLSSTSSTIIPSQIDFSQIPLLTHNDKYGTSLQSAAENANHIFNTLYSAMRQFSASYHHNGMSVFPATVPEGINLYHGRHDKDRVAGPEWLAFEMEHAELFARSFPGGGGPGPGNGRRPVEPPEDRLPTLELIDWNQVSEDPLPSPDAPGRSSGPGYLHTYRTNRPLRLLYIDGMGAAKADIGTLDTQDILLLNHTISSPMRERERARDLCALPKLWSIPIDGFLRMEAGFEIIHCDFSTEGGLDLVEARRRPETSGEISDHPEGYDLMRQFEYMRGASLRYNGISASRVELRFDKMISAYFYPANLTNPNPENQVLPRLPFEDVAQLETMRQDLRDVLANSSDEARGAQRGIDWQGMTDMIVTRYAGRLQYIASGPGYSTILSEINFLINTFINYDDPDIKKSIENCANNYITPARAFSTWSRQDHLLGTAVAHVSREICDTLFDVRDDLIDELIDEKAKASLAVNKIKDLMAYLDWSSWRECGKCAFDEVCFISMWPFGGKEEHFNPACKNRTTLMERHEGNEYWGRLRH